MMDDEQRKRQILEAIEEFVYDEDMRAENAARGATLRRWYDPDAQTWKIFNATYPLADDEQEIQVGERVFMPRNSTGTGKSFIATGCLRWLRNER
jgi:hypothetical protein